MPADTDPRPRLLVAVEDDAASLNAARYGATLADYLSLSRCLLHVEAIPPVQLRRMRALDTGEYEIAQGRARRSIKPVLEALGDPRWEALVRIGDVAMEVAAACRENQAALLVVGRRELGALSRWLLGNVSQEILHAVDLPLLIVPEGARPPERDLWHFVVATDLSVAARAALPTAAMLGAAGARLTVVHVGANEPSVDAELAAWSDELSASAVSVKTCRLDGDPLDAIPAAVEGLQATGVIVATHGRSALERVFVGSVAEGLLERLSCPTLVVRALARPSEAEA